MSGRVGLLLVNLGTPDSPRVSDVRRYLKEFLSDPRVVDINPVLRWVLLNIVILPLRPTKSAEAYKKVWMKEGGSPLLFHGLALQDALAERLPDIPVVLAMRYQTPSIAKGLDELFAAGCDEILMLPLFPQYASSSTGSAVEAVYREAGKRWNTPFVRVLPPFYEDAGFIDAFAQVGRPVIDELDPQHVLMSFHGLPERQVTKSDHTGKHCLASDGCCDRMVDANRNCYRAQCYATARRLAATLDLPDDQWSVAFQSRLGRAPWVKPYTDERIVELAKQGIERIAVYCPAFVADCLETIEEIGIRAEEDFREAGGKELRLIPSLNAHPAWVDAVAAMVEAHIDAAQQPARPSLATLDERAV